MGGGMQYKFCIFVPCDSFKELADYAAVQA